MELKAKRLGCVSAAAMLYWMTGQVVGLDEFNRNLLLLSEGAKVDLQVDSQALVSQGHNLLKISDLQKGDQVQVGYSTDGDRIVAQEIILQ